MNALVRIKPVTAAFTHPNGLVGAWGQARRFMGEAGRLATLPDLIDARLASHVNGVAWRERFVTTSAEYVGRSKAGKPIVIVAHGVGPLSSLDGILAAYGHEFKDKSRTARGGRISRTTFLQLESGQFGCVSVVDLRQMWKRRGYRFGSSPISLSEISDELLWKARLGSEWEAYCKRHIAHSLEWHMVQGNSPVYAQAILNMSDAPSCGYGTRDQFESAMSTGYGALAHLLCISGVTPVRHQYRLPGTKYLDVRSSFSSEVSCHEWRDAARFAATKSNWKTKFNVIHEGNGMLRRYMYWYADRLLRPCEPQQRNKLYAIMEFGHMLFSQYDKTGDAADTGEPEHRVLMFSAIGKPIQLAVPTNGFHGTCTYDVRDVQLHAPFLANGYQLVDEPRVSESDGRRYYNLTIQFCNVRVEDTKRLPRMTQLYDEHHVIESLLTPQHA